MDNELIKVVSLPVIEERLRTLEPKIKAEVDAALSLVCTEETIQTVKAKRAGLNKLSDDLERQRRYVKTSIMAPYNAFEAVYKECVTDALNAADSALKGKINAVELEQKRRCEEGLRDYFAELCAVHHVEWLTYEQADIKVDMASAKAKTPTKLRKQLAQFVARVEDDVNAIFGMENAEEIFVEYKKHLSPGIAVMTVQSRHREIAQEKTASEYRRETIQREAESVKRVEALTAPVVVQEEEPTFECIFTVHATKPQLRAIKEFLEKENIQYE